MKVAELRSQGWTAIQGDVIRGTFLMRLSEVTAKAVNQGINDHCEVINLSWRPLSMPYENVNMPLEFQAGGFWRPYFKPVVSIDEKPVFTQDMADNGELPPIGSLYLDDSSQVCKCIGYVFEKELVVGEMVEHVPIGGNIPLSICMGGMVKVIDTRTEKQKAVDAAMAEWPVADKATLELAYDLWAPKNEQ